MEINKKNIELYQIRNIGSCGWADITLEVGETEGRISIASDWGAWQRYWGHCGMGFKAFIISLKNNMHYFASKVDADNFFDLDQNITALKLSVIEYRRDESIDDQKARHLFEDLNRLQQEGFTRKVDFEYAYYETEHLSRWRHELDVITVVSPQFKNFWNKVYLPFVQHLESEVNADVVFNIILS